MPTNLLPEYFDAEKRYRQAATSQEKIAALEELISTVPKHKGTDKLRADLRKKLSHLREEAIKRKKSGKGDLYTVERQGAAQVALAGFPNSGKSSVLKTLTNANPVIAGYPMSTVMPLSGMMPFREPDMQTPFALAGGSAVMDLAERIHKDFVHNLKYACIWGSAKFDGQRVQKDYVLHDRDIVEFHVK